MAAYEEAGLWGSGVASAPWLHAAERCFNANSTVGVLPLRGGQHCVVIDGALAGPRTLRLFTQDPQIIQAATVLLWWTVLLGPGRTFNLVVINALRATGDVRFPVVAGAATMVVVLAWVPHARASHRWLRPAGGGPMATRCNACGHRQRKCRGGCPAHRLQPAAKVPGLAGRSPGVVAGGT
jgi:hypothetical protein